MKGWRDCQPFFYVLFGYYCRAPSLPRRTSGHAPFNRLRARLKMTLFFTLEGYAESGILGA